MAPLFKTYRADLYILLLYRYSLDLATKPAIQLQKQPLLFLQEKLIKKTLLGFLDFSEILTKITN